MRTHLRIAAGCLIVLALLGAQRTGVKRPPVPGAPAAAAAPAGVEAGMAVFFSPNGGALDALVREIDAARKTLDVQAYMLTTKDIAQPVVAAHKRGVKVRVLMDKGNALDQYSSATYFANAGVPVWVDGEHKEAHNKVMLIDGRLIVTGSMNFTKAAEEQNAENLLLIDGKRKLFDAYQRNFDEHLKHATPYKKPS